MLTGKAAVDHGCLGASNKRWKCARIIARTSSGSKRSNNPFQMMAIIPGAPINCGKRIRCIVGQLAAFERAAQQPRTDLRCARALRDSRIRRARKTRSFADDQPYQMLAMGAIYLSHENSMALSITVRSGRSAANVAFKGADDGVMLDGNQFLKQALLVLEVQINRTLRDICAFRDVVELRCRKTAGRKFVKRRVEDRITSRRRPGAARALWRAAAAEPGSPSSASASAVGDDVGAAAPF